MDSLTWLYYGDDEDSFFEATARNLMVFGAGLIFGPWALKRTMKYVNKSRDPDGTMRKQKLNAELAKEREELARKGAAKPGLLPSFSNPVAKVEEEDSSIMEL